MVNSESLYEEADLNDIAVITLECPLSESVSMSGYVGMDRDIMGNRERVCLAHELGHCITGSFYNRYAACDVKGKQEHRADIWAIKKLVPKDELEAAVKNGCIEIWDLAEYFGVTEPFMRKAVDYYSAR